MCLFEKRLLGLALDLFEYQEPARPVHKNEKLVQSFSNHGGEEKKNGWISLSVF